jgi:alpha-glucosidase
MYIENFRILTVVFSQFFFIYTAALFGQQKEILSPNGKIAVSVQIGNKLGFTVRATGKQVLTLQQATLLIRDHETDFGIVSVKSRSADLKQKPLIREKRAVVSDQFNELTVEFKSKIGLCVRVYDDGFAYRYFTHFKEDSVIVMNETGTLQFNTGDSLYLPIIHCRSEKGVDCFHTSNEEDYVHRSPSQVEADQLAYLPIYARTASGISLSIAESDLHDYPGMYLGGNNNRDNTLNLRFSAYPAEVAVFGDYFKQELVTRRAEYLARTSGNRNYPWRVFILGEHDKDLVNSDMVYRLASACKIENTGWIKPGKITDEWITNSILYGVDFKSGINTETYKYYIDFAHQYGMPYIFMDAGWCEPSDFTKLNPNVNIPEIVRYGQEKQVGIWLWTCALTLKDHMEYIPLFSKWGVKGIMADFMDREDQLMIRFQETVAQETASNRLMLLFHGTSKPTGLRKMYPNLMIREGVMGHEYNKWSDRVTPEHDLIIPFTRMIAGPLDYEGGGMLNAQKKDFRIVDSAPMIQGTRLHQLAMYVVYESPLQYLGGNICDYLKDPDYTRFFSEIPVEWDETLVLDGKISDYILIARRSGKEWWVGAMTDWTTRSLELDLSFLGNGKYKAEIAKDGINADVYAADYKMDSLQVTASDHITVKMAPGGGWVGRFRLE